MRENEGDLRRIPRPSDGERPPVVVAGPILAEAFEILRLRQDHLRRQNGQQRLESGAIRRWNSRHLDFPRENRCSGSGIYCRVIIQPHW